MINESAPRLGLVGLGGYGQHHISCLSTLHEAGLCRFAAAADPFAARHGETVAALQSREAAIYASLQEMLERAELDAVYLATPLHLHAAQTVAALEAGLHVYLEKPPCATLGEWQRMMAAQEKSGRICAVGFQMQSSAALRFLRRQLAEGAIGPLRRVWGAIRWRRTDAYYGRSPWVGHWRVEGLPVFDGPATNALSHAVQAALSLSAPGSGAPLLKRVRGALWRARPIESYDSAFLEAETSEGVEMRLAMTHATSFLDEVILRCAGDDGEAQLNWNGRVQLQRKGEAARVWKFGDQASLAATLDFRRALTQPGHIPDSPLESTLAYLQVVNGALQSTQSTQSTHGAHVFAPERVEEIKKDTPDAFYRVAGLDKEIAAFQADFDAPPPSFCLTETPWIAPGDLKLDLPAGLGN